MSVLRSTEPVAFSPIQESPRLGPSSPGVDSHSNRAIMNVVVPAGLWRPLVALAFVPWLVCASALPAEHLHEADADHPHSLIHRHAEPHEFESHHDGAEVSHSEEGVVWLSDASVLQATYQFDVSWAVVARIYESVPDTASWFATVSYDGSPPHGPPRPCRSPRAPPHTSA